MGSAWLDYRAMLKGASSLVTLSDSPIEAITGITKTGNDKAVFVEFLVESPQDNGDIAAFGGFLEGGKSLGSP